MKHYHNGKLYISTDELARDFTRRYGVKVLPKHINRICHHYKVNHLEWRGMNFFSNSGVINMCEQKPGFSEVLDNVLTFDNAYGCKPQTKQAQTVQKKDEYKPIDYTPKESDMEYVSKQLIDKYQTEGKIIRLTEGQYIRLFENSEDEGFRLYKDGTYRFKPNSEENADTSIFNDDKSLKVNAMFLPKSQVKCYNLYAIKNMSVNKALKHQKDLKGNDVKWYNNNEEYSSTIEYFIKRSALYIRHLIGNSSVDYFTCPQSSSEFNKIMLKRILSYYPQSSGIILKPDMLVKNVRGIYVNTDYAKQLGMTDKEIHDLQVRVEKWHSDEDIRDKRRELDKLKDEIAQTIANRKRGRPSLDFIRKQELAKTYQDQISIMRKGKRGLDPTKDASGRMKPWQIKSLDDKDRRAIEGLFEINPEYNGIQSKLVGKTIVVFDDNISSGATMDDFCLKLKQLGVANILAFTLGTIDPTIYKQSDRSNRL